MSVRLAGTQLSDPGPADSRKPLVLLGPSLGTSVHALWSPCVRDLADRFHLVGWDLPGHGVSPAVTGTATDMAELAAGVLDLADSVQAERGEPAGPFAYAGDSVGGAVGLQLLVDAPERVRSAVILASSAAFGAMPGWTDRAATARASGTASLVALSLQRWFAEGFAAHDPDRVSALLHSLRETDDESYAQVCEALSRFDLRGRLGEVTAPVLAVAGSEDVATPPEQLEQIADAIRGTRLVVLDGVGHLPPAEAPSVVGKLLGQHLEPTAHPAPRIPVVDAESASEPAADPVYERGMTVRREVLGDAHVDRAVAATTDLTRDFQDLITRYAWGSIWTRPGLDRRSRSMITLTALIARGHHEELAMHLRAARRNGLTDDEIREVILQSAIYCGVPDANTAFRVAQTVLSEPFPTSDPTPASTPATTQEQSR
jgi:3-oxoadipate enol-lactonase/4-carboxymuconolactone decarboxylase